MARYNDLRDGVDSKGTALERWLFDLVDDLETLKAAINTNHASAVGELKTKKE